MSSKWAQFLLTPTGRNVLMGGATFASISGFSWHFFPNTFFLENYKNIVQYYESGMSKPVSVKLRTRFEKAMDLAEVAPEDRKLFRPFNVFGFDIFSAGSVFSKFGCIVGFPANFNYEDIDSINKHDIKVGGESVPWSSDEGELLLKSMFLSEDAQLYAMAREIKMLHTPKKILDAFSSMASVIVTYSVCAAMNKKLDLYSRPFLMRAFMYTLVTLFVGGNYVFAKDYSQIHYEKKIDEELKTKDPILEKGGAEFYRKVLMRNQALRKLLGKEGESKFSVLGNENYLIRQKHWPIIQRKEFFEGKAQLS